jgi:hypothetical protein
VCDVRTIHGTFGSNARTENRDRRTLLRIGWVGIALDRYQAHLPPAPSANRPSEGAPRPGPVAPFKPSGIDPMNREPTATPGSTAPFKPSRIDPMNREPAANLAPTAPFKPFRIDPMNREPTAKPTPTAAFKPFRIDPMNREPAAKPASTAPFKPFRIDPMNREPGAFPGPDPLRPGHRFHAHARSRQSTRRAALTAPAPQARNFAADERR